MEKEKNPVRRLMPLAAAMLLAALIPLETAALFGARKETAAPAPGAPIAQNMEIRVYRGVACSGVLRATGCDRCLEGYVGRVGVFELLPCGGAVADAIHAGRLASGDLRAAAGGAFRPMSADAARKLRDGVTTPAEVLAALGSGAL